MSVSAKSPEIFEENKWMLRPCHIYYEEYKDCKSIKAKFHQYFIYGEFIDCSQWKKDYDNCTRWQDDNDKTAATEVIENEMKRRKERLDAHYNNDIWEKRKNPPEDWAQPLPEWMQKENENSYLGVKSKEIKEDAVADTLTNRTLCSIM